MLPAEFHDHRFARATRRWAFIDLGHQEQHG
jgi:hypothetical protein